MKNKILTGLAVLLAAIGMFSCQREEVAPPLFEPTVEHTELAKEQGLVEALTTFTGDNLTAANGRVESSELAFGTLDYSEIVKTIASEDQPLPNYTIRLIPPDTVRNTIEYLVVAGEEDGYWGYIMQYEADPEHWLTLFDRAHFTGSLRLLDFQRNVIAHNLFEDGQDVGSLELPQPATDGRQQVLEIIGGTNCVCAYGTTTSTSRNVRGHLITVYHNIVCECTDWSLFQGEGHGSSDGGDWNTFPPGQPINGGGGTSGGLDDGLGGGPRLPGDGITPGDAAGTMNLIVDDEVREILEDDEFMSFFTDPEQNPCIEDAADVIQNDVPLLKKIYGWWRVIIHQVILREVICSEIAPISEDAVHDLLDMIGMMPVVGPFADGANTVIYISEGEYLNASLSGIAVIPVIGAAGATVKYLIKHIDVNSPVSRVLGDIAKNASLPQKIRLIRKLIDFNQESLKRLAKSLTDNPEVLKAMLNDAKILDAWKAVDDVLAETGEFLRKDEVALKQIKESFEDGLDAMDAVEDAIQTFKDVSILPSAKPTWEQIKAWFKRGNDFNAKGRLEYEFNEINLFDGKRLDSYIPGEQIVSRKATTLSQIKTTTFESYLRELTTKYSKGKTINTKKIGYEDINRTVLSGKYYLEIPTVNRQFFESSSTLKSLAEQYDVIIKYLDE